MSPSHANKKGVRYRYYVSHAVLQNRKANAGSIARVSAPDVEVLVCNAVKQKKQSASKIPERELLQRHVERVTVHPKELKIMLRGDEDGAETGAPTCLSIPFIPNLPCKKGITHAPTDQETMDSQTRDALMQAIGRSRGWLDSILSREAASFDELATAEALAERHVRFLMPLAFLSPRIVGAIADGTVPTGLTVSGLARSLPHKWIEQERMFWLS